MASGDKFYLADKATLDEVKGKIGNITDTGGSSIAGTMMAKENAILSEVGKLGAANDTQSSSTTTGSIFAKLNYLVSQVSLYLSNIFTRIGAQADSNATGSKGSSVHGKMNWFIDLFGKTDDTGGTKTTGTVMGKLNRIIEYGGEDVFDNDVIKAGTNLQTPIFANLPAGYTEVLNVTGEGYLSSIALKSAQIGHTTKMKMYIDDELFFDFGIQSQGTTAPFLQYISCLVLAGTTMYTGNMIPFLNEFVNGNVKNLTNNNSAYIANRLLHFKNSLRVVACSNIASNDDYVSVYYALKE